MAPSNFTPNERLLRKRLAARLRQRRCRERKRELIISGIDSTRTGSLEETNKSDSSISAECTASTDNSTGYSSSKSTPASSPSKVDPVYVNVQNIRPPPPQGGYSWTYPVMPPIPRSKAPPPPPANYQYTQPPPSVPPHSNGSYYGPPSHHHHHPHYHPHAPLVPMMYSHPHHQYMSHGPPHSHSSYLPHKQRSSGSHGLPPYPVPAYGPPPPISHSTLHPSTEQPKGSYQPTTEADPGDVSRTVSRSPSDVSMNSGKAAALTDKMRQEAKQADVYDKTAESNTNSTTVLTDDTVDPTIYSIKKTKITHKSRSNAKSLMSTEKAAVAAMLAMKTSSDESDGDSISAVTNKSLSRIETKQQQPPSTQQQQQHSLNSLSLVASV